MIENVYPLSPLQEGLYFHWLSAPDSQAYLMQQSYQLKGKLNVNLLRSSYQELVSRHAALRTFFTQELGPQVLQVVRKEAEAVFTYKNIAGDSTFSAEQYKRADREKGFNLHAGSQMRLTVLESDNDTYEFIWSFHHILMDAWCVGILIQEFFKIYSCLLNNIRPSLARVYPYSGYIEWLMKTDRKNSLSYWNHYLDGFDTRSSLPRLSAHTRQEQADSEYAFSLSADISSSIKTFCTREEVTENTFFQSVWAILLSRYNDSNDVVFGSVVSGRSGEVRGMEEMIGLFINTIPVRVQLENDSSVRTLLRDVQQRSVEGLKHHYIQLAELQSAGQPLFDHILQFQNVPTQMRTQDLTGGLSLVESTAVGYNTFGFTCIIVPGETTGINFQYSALSFDRTIVGQIGEHLVNLIRQILEQPTAAISALTLLTEVEQEKILTDFNDTDTPPLPFKTILDLFKKQALNRPAHTALIHEKETLTYKELDEQSDRLANYLLANHRVAADERIGIMLDRSALMIVSILGVLKAGAAYVPVDPSYPEKRKAFMMSDAGIDLLITQSDYLFELTYYKGKIFAADIQSEGLKPVAELDAPPVRPEQLAYVIYTSGSTGNPKGVMVEHGNLLNYLLNNKTSYIGDDENVTGSYIHLSYTFDASLTAIFMPLLHGRSVVIAENGPATVFNDTLFRQYAPYDFIKLTPIHMQLLETAMQSNSSMQWARRLVLGGEALQSGHISFLAEMGQDVEIINEYGPTEATVGCTTYSFRSVDTAIFRQDISIGKPIDNTRIYILDSTGRVVPVGVTGELCVAGAGVARGYLNQQELTARKFVPDPFREGVRMYRTGDAGRWLPDGNIEYKGRVDDQVKIHGYRIEPGEIEHALQLHPQIRSAVVIVTTNNAGDKVLAAYVTSMTAIVSADIQAYLSTILPDYMVPRYIIQLEELPVTSNGKVDRKQLPALSYIEDITAAYVAPGNETEEKLVMIWEEILGKKPIGIKDNFFDLGGHSLKATRLAAQLHRVFNVRIGLNELFTFATPEEQAQLITQAGSNQFWAIPATAASPHYPLSSSQRRLWVLSQFEDGNIAYNVSGAFELSGTLDRSAFSLALEALTDRHEILRTVFREDENGDIRQFIIPHKTSDRILTYRDIRQHAAPSYLSDCLQELFQASFDLTVGPLIRVALYQVADDKWILGYTMHHIISDAWSMEVMIRELFGLYNGFVAGVPAALTPLRIQYKDYAAWQQEQLNGAAMEEHRAYWLTQFAGDLPVLNLPGDRTRPVMKTYRGNAVHRQLNKKTLKGIKTLCWEEGATLFMGLLAAVNTLLYRYTGQEDIIVGSQIAGREHADMENQIGIYLNTLALRSRFSASDNYRELLEKTRETAMKAYEHQLFPFDDLVDSLSLQHDMSRHPLFDVSVVLQNATLHDTPQQQLTGLRMQEFTGTVNPVSKFDLAFDFAETGEELRASLVYNSDIYDESTAARLLAHLEQLLQAAVKDPSVAIGQLDYLSPDEKNSLLTLLDNTAVTYPEHKTITSLFEEQAGKTPDNIAIISEHTTLSYLTLNETANQLSAFLKERCSLAAGDLVAIKLERTEWMIITILAILKAGGAYVPMDPAYPQERIDYMMDDSRSKLAVTDELLLRFKEEQHQYSTGNPVPAGTPDSLAYVIYTSGTTGNPKGALITHRNVVRLFKNDSELFDFNQDDVWTMFHSYCFDFSVWEMYGALFYGGKLVIVPTAATKDPAAFTTLLKHTGTTICNQTPSSFYNIAEHILENEELPLNLRYVIFGGEALSPGRLAGWHQQYPDVRLVNMYGITETTVHVTYKEITENEIAANISNIGRPIPTLSAYILDQHRQLVPPGVWGELYVGGAGVCNGYLNREDLTRQRFVNNPFREGSRLYRTGDLVKLTTGGEIVYGGRLDRQVKIRGFRVELGEIVNVLQQYEGVVSAVVTARIAADGDAELVAYVAGDTALHVTDIKAYLSRLLPSFMLPAYYVVLDEIPLTVNGKVDEKKLPDPVAPGLYNGNAYVPPRNTIEEKLVELWQEVLGRPQISVKDNFFELGGHSLKVTRLGARIHKVFDVKLSLNDLFMHAVLEEQAQLIAGAGQDSFSLIPAIPLQPHYPLSSSQRRLWILSQFEGGNATYNIPNVYTFSGKLDTVAFLEALEALVDRHEILRTVFREDENGEIQQFIEEGTALTAGPLFFDLRMKKDARLQLTSLLEQSVGAPFQLAAGPLFRVALYQLEDDEWVCCTVMHHIISDAWSMNILIRELLLLYNARVKETPDLLPPLRIHYKDYTVWQREQLSGPALEQDRSYWLEQFATDMPVLELPGDHGRPSQKTYNGDIVSYRVPAETISAITALAQEQDATLFMVLLAAVNVLLYRHTGQEDIVIGSQIAGRGHTDLEDQIGLYLNTLALRARFKGNNSFRELLEHIRQVTLGAYDHQLYPFDDLVNELHLRHDPGRHPLFDVSVVLQDAVTEGTSWQMEGIRVDNYGDIETKVSKFDLAFDFIEVGNEVQASLIYNTDIYSRSTALRLAGHLERLLSSITKNPDLPLYQLNYLDVAEKEQLLHEFNKTTAEYPRNSNIVSLFREQVRRTSGNTALVFEDQRYTYHQLEELSDRLSDHLISSYDLQQGSFVGILLNRSVDMIISILAVLKAGCAYVPIDPEFPVARQLFMLDDTGSGLVITEPAYATSLEDYKGDIFMFGAPLPEADGPPVLKAREIHPESIAYVMYTSGTTGMPKGVPVLHRGVVRLVRSSNFIQLTGDEVLLSTGAVSFDATTFEYWGMLLNGGRLILSDKDTLLDTGQLSALISRHKVTTMWFTAGWLNQLVDKDIDLFEGIRTIIAGGDRLSALHIAMLRKQYPSMEIINGYGPTENTTFSLYYPVGTVAEDIPIGRPISNSTAYILDDYTQLCGIGITGEIYVGGDGLAAGYLNNLALTAEKFIPHPYMPGEQLYKTGDLGRLLPDGNIVFIGRKDSQVKIRGYRVETGEVESVIRRYAQVENVVVVARPGSDGDKLLVAYVVSHETLETADLRSYLRNILPVHMIPAYFVQLEQLPLNTNGKVDRAALPDPHELEVSTGVVYVAPRNETERKLVHIWEEVLEVENVGVKDNFFDLGGHSLKAIRVISQIHKVFNVKLPLKDLFAHLVLEEQAGLIDQAGKSAFVGIAPVEEQPDYVLSSSQRRLWVLSQFEDSNIAYNMPGVYVFNGMLDQQALTLAFDTLIARHEILRTVFREDEHGTARQVVCTPEESGFLFSYTDLRQDAEPETALKKLLEDAAIQPFDLSSGPLLRAGLFRLSEHRWVLSYVMHHIISDGWSMNILINELSEYYQGYLNGTFTKPEPLKIQYRDYAVWQQEQLSGTTLGQHRSYWLKQFEGTLPVLAFPGDHTRPVIKTYNGDIVTVTINEEITSGIKKLSGQHGGTLFMGLLAAVNVLLFRYTEQEDIIIGTPIAGRDHADIANQIGFYVNTLALRTAFKGTGSYVDLLNNVREITLGAYEHQVYPFDELVEALQLQHDMGRHPLFDTVVAVQNNGSDYTGWNAQSGLSSVSEYETGALPVSKFDWQLTFIETGDVLQLGITYNTDIYNRSTALRLAAHLERLLSSIIKNPDLPLYQLEYLGDAEKEQLLHEFNRTTVEYPRNSNIVSLFREQARRTPTNTALVFEDQHYTYHQLEELSDHLSDHLISSYDLQQGGFVGILLNRSADMLISILAVLKAGCAYVPIDPEFPVASQLFMLNDTGSGLVITEPAYAAGLEDYKGDVFIFGAPLSEADDIPVSKVREIHPEDIAYVMYTSGTTGMPKGVSVLHRGVVRLVRSSNFIQLTGDEVLLSTGAVSFDATTFEYWSMLLNGGRLILSDKDTLLDTGQLSALISRHKVTTMWFTAGWLNQLVDKDIGLFEGIRTIIAGGDRLSASHITMLRKQYPSMEIVNGYGPTENTTFSLCYTVGTVAEDIPIGRPVSNSTAYILDDYTQLCGIGITGEIYVGGDGLAAGYLNNPLLTAEKFIPHPYKPGEQLYKTGDLGRLLPDGNILFVGRKDNQVKVRGYRVELAEIENALQTYAPVNEAAVVARTDKYGEKVLIAYLVAGGALDVISLRTYLVSYLPLHMVPAHFVQLEEFPLNANGKVDRKALPDPEEAGLHTGIEYVAPRNETEEKLLLIWQEILSRNKISVKDNFFELGGHSIKATRLIGHIHNVFGVSVNIREVFRSPTIEGMSDLIRADKWVGQSVNANGKSRNTIEI
ncbi:non-ribosomal peptide synthetase [Chitinophaga flava]|uniref:Carrier domain-containing protein n=1 Tax=Chitinophaga flava TaxID=2259036 RepID=A0A365XY49_9BACT|nr:non-ribosomal peptide synthetase [Chitinophaga flava]RBL90505.1 hypothetical protein DF182_29045 [Chitinophaga flava]